MRRLAALITLSTCLPVALADETYPVRGRLGDGAEYEGEVALRAGDGDAVHVTHTLGAGVVLTGEGRRTGDLVLAEVARTIGAAEVVGELGSAVPAREPLQLSFRRNAEGTRWRVRVHGPDGLVALGHGRRAPTPPTTDAARQWVEYAGVPFVRAPEDDDEVHESDPRQGQLGDCYFVAGLIAVARTRPDAIRSMIADKGDGLYEVTLRGVGRFLYVFSQDVRIEVDRRVPAGATGKPVYARLADEEQRGDQVVYELWPIMIERAYAQHRGGYEAIAGGMPGTVYELVGGGTSSHQAASMSDEEIRAVLDAALEAGKPISLAFTRKDLGEMGRTTHVVAWHSYVVTGSRDGGYVLHNPWGSSHPPRPLTPAQLRELAPTIQVGEL